MFNVSKAVLRERCEHESITVQISSYKEKTTVKHMLLALATAVLVLNTLVIPTVARADGGGGGTGCGTTLCKP
jgi:hypothetical protein